MAFLTPAQKTQLLALLATNNLSGTEENAAANVLNAPTTTTATVPTPFTAGTVLNALAAASLVKVLASPFVGVLLDALNRQDKPTIVAYGSVLVKGSVLTAADVTAVQAIINATSSVSVAGPSLFKAAFPGFSYVVDGVGYVEQATAALILEARG